MKHLAIVGNIGSGKTTLTQMLSRHFEWEATFESTEDNPYLADFYGDMQKWAFHLQIYFLNNRFQQVQGIQASQSPVIQDRTIYEDAHIFAANLHQSGILSKRDFLNYRGIYDSIIGTVTPPDLLIYLKADLPRLISQINKRGRDYEAGMDPKYLESLNELYHNWIDSYSHSPVVVIDMNNTDFVNKPEDFHGIVERVDEFRKELATGLVG